MRKQLDRRGFADGRNPDNGARSNTQQECGWFTRGEHVERFARLTSRGCKRTKWSQVVRHGCDARSLTRGWQAQDGQLFSYRHSFHAGNFADVLKHIVVVEVLQHLLLKQTAFHYFETHAGAGLYDLESEHAQKLQEHLSGVGKLEASDWPELASYFAALDVHNDSAGLRFYPGSPMLARHLMRRCDRAWLFELHPREVENLRSNVGCDRRIKVVHEDGFKSLQALLPPLSRRGLVLIDPSYELKTDYEQVIVTLLAGQRKFATGTYALWYPVVERWRVEQLETDIRSSGIRNVQRFELAVATDSSLCGMTASGMIVVNPPWTLMTKMSQLLPRLVAALKRADGARFVADVLVGE